MAIHHKDSIGLIGFSASEQTMLELFFNGRQQKLFTLSSPEKADALLVDLSSTMGMTKFMQFQRLHPAKFPHLHGVALTDNEDVPEGFISLKRPLTLTALSDALEALKKLLHKTPLESLAKSDRQTVFAEWQARKQAGVEAMQKWNQGKRLQSDGQKLFPLDRHGVQEVISKAHLVMAHRRHEVAPGDPALAVVSLDPDEAASITSARNHDESQVEVSPLEVNKKASVKTAPSVSRENKRTADSTEKPAVDRLHDYCGHLPDQDLNDPSGLRRVKFNLERSLLPWVEQAVKLGRQSQQAQQVVGLPGVLIYLPSDDSFFCDLDEDLLLHMARAKFGLDELSLSVLEPSSAVKAEKSRHIVADQLVWKIALLTSRGRISEVIDLKKPLQLIRKPDFNHFEIIPHARTLAELWYSKRLSPLQILEESSVPQRYVFTFLVAADAVGYFNP